MFLIFCSKADHEGLWLYDQVRQFPGLRAEIFFSEDIYEACDWELRISDHAHFAKVHLPGDVLINTENVTVFMNRVQGLWHPYWNKLPAPEKNYFCQEWNAFLTGWLKAFEPVLINAPRPAMLGGYTASHLKWALLAAQSGFKITAQHFNSNDTDIRQLQGQDDKHHLKTLLVFDKKVYAPVGLAHLAEASLALSEKVGCKLLEILVDDKGASNQFITATSMPSFSSHPYRFVERMRGYILEKQHLPFAAPVPVSV